MRRLLLYGMVFGSLLACAAAVLLVTWAKTRGIAASRESRGAQLECGHWCVYRCGWMLGAPVDMEDVTRLLPLRPGGHSLTDLREALHQIGLEAAGYKESFDSLREGEFPCILHLKDPEHFVVAAGRLKTGMLVFDGTGMRRRVLEETLKQRWTGNMLRVRRSPESPVLPRFIDRTTDGVPCIQFETLHADRGDVPRREPIVSFVYPFWNRGSQPLVVEKVETDCKCLAVEQPKEPVLPGGRAQIVLKYSTRAAKSRGVFHHEAVVKSNDPTYPLLPLHASGNADVRVTSGPRVLDFGQIVAGRPATAFCFVSFTGEDFDSFAITGLRCSLPGVESRTISPHEYKERISAPIPATPAEDFSGRVRIVELTYPAAAGSKPGAELSGTLEFETSVEDLGTISVPVRGRVVAPVAVVPSALDFGELRGQPGAKASASLALRSLDGRRFRVLGVKSDLPAQPFESSVSERDGKVALNVACDEAVALKCHKSILNIRVQMDNSEDALLVPVVIYAWRAPPNVPQSR